MIYENICKLAKANGYLTNKLEEKQMYRRAVFANGEIV